MNIIDINVWNTTTKNSSLQSKLRITTNLDYNKNMEPLTAND